jgi:hypothetical protein
MNLLTLPEIISGDIVAEWLPSKELGIFDSAVCNLKSRTTLVGLLQSCSLNIKQCRTKSFMIWVSTRRIKLKSLSFFDTDKIHWSDFDTSELNHIEFVSKDPTLFKKCPASVHIIINNCTHLKSLKIGAISSFSKEFLDGISKDILISLTELYIETDNKQNLKLITRFSEICVNVTKLTIKIKGLDIHGKDLLSLLQKNPKLSEFYITVDVSLRFRLGGFYSIVKSVTSNLQRFVVTDDLGAKLCMLI